MRKLGLFFFLSLWLVELRTQLLAKMLFLDCSALRSGAQGKAVTFQIYGTLMLRQFYSKRQVMLNGLSQVLNVKQFSVSLAQKKNCLKSNLNCSSIHLNKFLVYNQYGLIFTMKNVWFELLKVSIKRVYLLLSSLDFLFRDI